MENQNFPPQQPSSQPKTKIIVAVAAIIFVVVGVLAVTYYVAQSNVANAANTFEISTQNVEITDLSLFPPSVDLKANVIVKNPSTIEFTVNKYQADIYLKYGSEMFSIGNVDVTNKPLNSNGYVTIPAEMHCGSDVINFLTQHPTGFKFVISGTVSVSGKYLFWTITNEKPVEIEQDSLNSNQIPITPLPDYTYSPTQIPIMPTASPTPERNIAISYSLKTESFYTWSSSGYNFDQQADSGKMFVEVTVAVKNNGYDSFSTNQYYFNLVSNNVKYSTDAGTYLLDKWEMVDVLDGGTFTGTMLFQVPTSASSFVLGYDSYYPTYNIIWTKI